MLLTFYWDPNPEIFSLPFLNFPILWYGVCFALGFWFAFLVFIRVLGRFFVLTGRRLGNAELKKKAHGIADRLTVYIVIGTILGARVGHFLFYENPSAYLSDPLEFFRFRNGGLASHGAVVGIILATLLFSYRIRKSEPELNWVRLLDLISPSTALAGVFIRIGNFFNQEILGTQTNLPWAIVFGHPADGSFPVSRHPAQLYEALWYLAVFFLLCCLSHQARFLLSKGKLVGLFLILVFAFRFFIEFLKTEQSHLLQASYLTMGQFLSLPAILLGLFFCFNRSFSKR